MENIVREIKQQQKTDAKLIKIRQRLTAVSYTHLIKNAEASTIITGIKITTETTIMRIIIITTKSNDFLY